MSACLYQREVAQKVSIVAISSKDDEMPALLIGALGQAQSVKSADCSSNTFDGTVWLETLCSVVNVHLYRSSNSL